jgi:hypothetical protein
MRPAVGSIVVLNEQTGAAYPAEVLDVQEGFLRVNKPADQPGVDNIALGARLLVSWTQPHGRIHLPVVLAARDTESTWVLDVTAEPWREQRRQYDRAVIELTATVQLRPTATGSSDDVATGDLVDLSEVGMRCSVKDSPDFLNTANVAVEVDLILHELPLTVLGQVLQTRASRPGEAREVVVLFDRPVAQAEQIRDYVARAKGGR